MKKIIYSLSVLGLLIALSANATVGISLNTTQNSFAQGQLVTVPVSVTPQGDTVYTVKVALSYSPDVLEFRSFSFGSDWMPLKQTGYDSVDSVHGVMTKTAGYPGGVSAKTFFGNAVFYAKQTGQASIAVESDSLVLNQASVDAFDKVLSKKSISIVAPKITPKVVTPTPIPTSTPQQVVPEEKKAVSAPVPEIGSIDKVGKYELLAAYVFAPFNPVVLLVVVVVLLLITLLLRKEVRDKEIIFLKHLFKK
jgi:hypothetical protein